MRRLYPEALADKSFDNTGLLLEAPFQPDRRRQNSVLLTIDLTRSVADEAIENNHSVVVAYHPIIFRGLKSLTLNDSQQSSLLRLAAYGISVYCPHTAVDTVPDGMADWLCDVVTGKIDAPEPEVTVGDAQSSASETDVTTSEESSTHSDSTKPTSPSADQDSSDPFTSPTPKEKPKSKARPSNNQRTYSKPTYPRPTSDFHPASIAHTRSVVTPSPSSAIESANTLTSSSRFTPGNTGAGRLITFDNAQPLTVLITRIAHAIGLPRGFPVAIPQFASIEDIQIKTVGLCPGSGSHVLSACRPAPDLVFTGELSHHEALAVTERGGCVISLFHSNSERGYLWGVMRDRLEEELREEWEKVRNDEKGADPRTQEMLQDEMVGVEVSTRDRDPFGIVILQDSLVPGVEL